MKLLILLYQASRFYKRDIIYVSFDRQLMQCLQPIISLHHLDVNTGGLMGTIRQDNIPVMWSINEFSIVSCITNFKFYFALSWLCVIPSSSSFFFFQALQWTSTEGLQTTCAAALELPNLNYVWSPVYMDFANFTFIHNSDHKNKAVLF